MIKEAAGTIETTTGTEIDSRALRSDTIDCSFPSAAAEAGAHSAADARVVASARVTIDRPRPLEIRKKTQPERIKKTPVPFFLSSAFRRGQQIARKSGVGRTVNR